MKNCYLYLLAIVSLLGFLSCSKDNATEKDARKEVKVTATFNGLSATGGVTTRAVDNGWEVGDAIGLFMKKAGIALAKDALANNVKYTTNGDGAFTNPSVNKVYFPFKKENVDFISYYPYTDKLNGFIYEVDVSDQSNLASIDLMYADNVEAKNYTSGSIELDFKHQLTKVVLKITNNNSDNTTGDFTAKITNARKNADFSLINGELTVVDEWSDIIFNVVENSMTAEAILLPDKDLTGKKFLITIGDISYSYTLSNSQTIKSFAASTKCEYSITIEPNNDRILNNVTATITDWKTVKEDIVADEVQVADADGGNTEPGGDVTPPVPGDGGSTEPGEDDDPVLPDGGVGTKENPYSIAEIIDMMSKNDVVNPEDIWIRGFIVGCYYNNKFTTDAVNFSSLNIALADFKTENIEEKIFPVDLTIGEVKLPDFRAQLILFSKPENIGKEILLKGSICPWEERVAIKYLKEVFLEGEELIGVKR